MTSFAKRTLATVGVVASIAAFWNSQALTVRLIETVGFERALGPDSVYYTKEGGVLLTNPGAMLLWALPVWTGSAALLIASLLLAVTTSSGKRPYENA